MLKKNKKAVSEMVGYVILIVISISLSILVYSFLRVYIPKDRIECSEDINLIVGDASCSFSKGQINLTIVNKGLFKVDAAYVRFGNETQKIRQQINQDDFLLFGPENTPGLNPGESFKSVYNTNMITAPGRYILELQPIIIRNKKLIVCEKDIITHPVQCT